MWGDVKSLANPGVGSATGAPGSSNGPGFGWQNQTVWRAGAAYDVLPELTLRAGYNHGSKLIDSQDTYLGLLAPSANRRHATAGATYRLSKDHELSVAYARSFKEKVKGDGPGPDGLTNLYMGQHWLSLSYGIAF
ncbi:Outer membrane protein transport protein (OMPP1/FadL/TodX) [compost metagenome]